MLSLKLFVIIAVVVIITWNQVYAVIPNAVVSKDGSGDYTTVSEAIMAAPNRSLNRYVILVKAVIYKEYINVRREKPNLTLIGEGKEKTVISGNKSFGGGGVKTFDTATVAIHATGFVARDITFENTATPEMHQAVALLSNANFLAFFRCRFKGYQDTLYAKAGKQFFRECEVQGTVDFIFGDATVIFQNCIIYVRRPLPGQSNTITAQSRIQPQDSSGTVISNSTIMASKELEQQFPRARTYLGRPWKKLSRTVIMKSFIDDIIDRAGWLPWNGKVYHSVYYAEYQNTGPGANTSGRVSWSKVINITEARAFTVRNFIQGDRWIPSGIPFFLDIP